MRTLRLARELLDGHSLVKLEVLGDPKTLYPDVEETLKAARVLVKDPAIIILDEATSHLDSENESLVQQALAVALKGRTALVIAHRLSTITDADQILVLDGGRIVERGRHDDLVHDDGLYADLYRTLVRGDLEGAERTP